MAINATLILISSDFLRINSNKLRIWYTNKTKENTLTSIFIKGEEKEKEKEEYHRHRRRKILRLKISFLGGMVFRKIKTKPTPL